MTQIKRRVALVTGGSRGAGAGIARALGSHGLRVYITGRAETVGEAKGWDGAALPGTIHSTAAEVTEAGGEGIALRCDHADDAQVRAVFEHIQSASGRLDILLEVSLLSAYNASPRQGHLDQAYNIFAYLKRHKTQCILFDPSTPDINVDVDFKEFDDDAWKDFNEPEEEALPSDMPSPRA